MNASRVLYVSERNKSTSKMMEQRTVKVSETNIQIWIGDIEIWNTPRYIQCFIMLPEVRFVEQNHSSACAHAQTFFEEQGIFQDDWDHGRITYCVNHDDGTQEIGFRYYDHTVDETIEMARRFKRALNITT